MAKLLESPKNYWLKRHHDRGWKAALFKYDFFNGFYQYFGHVPMQTKVIWNLSDFPNDERVNGIAIIQSGVVIYKQDLVPPQLLPSDSTLTVDFSKLRLD